MLIDGFKTNSILKIIYSIIFIVRRILTVIIIMYMMSYPFFQSTFLMIFSAINLLYTFSLYPFKERLENRVEIFNELTIYINQHLFTLLLNGAIPLHVRKIISWTMIGNSLLNISLSVIILVSTQLKGLIYYLRNKYQ